MPNNPYYTLTLNVKCINELYIHAYATPYNVDCYTWYLDNDDLQYECRDFVHSNYK